MCIRDRSIGILLFLIVLTLLFGRVYCSTICPMGILQDVIARISNCLLYTSGSAKEKIESLEAVGIRVAQEPSDIPKLLK